MKFFDGLLFFDNKVRKDADQMVADAIAYDADPSNSSLEARYATSQKRLAERIKEIVDLCGDQVFFCLLFFEN